MLVQLTHRVDSKKICCLRPYLDSSSRRIASQGGVSLQSSCRQDEVPQSTCSGVRADVVAGGRNVGTSMSVDAVVISYKSLAGGKATVLQYGQGENITSPPTCLLQKRMPTYHTSQFCRWNACKPCINLGSDRSTKLHIHTVPELQDLKRAARLDGHRETGGDG